MRISDWGSDVCSSDLEGDDRPFRGELFTALARPLGKIVAGVDHRRGDPPRYPAAARRGVGTAGLDAIDFGGMVAHAFHGAAASLPCLAAQLRFFEFRGADLARIDGMLETAKFLRCVIFPAFDPLARSVELRVGYEGVSTC